MTRPVVISVLAAQFACLLACFACGCAAAPRQLAGTRSLAPDAAVLSAVPAVALASEPTRSVLPAQPPRIVISELLVDPLLLDDGAGEFIEIVNLSPLAVRLGDLELALPSGRGLTPERPSLPILRAGEVLLLTPLGKGPGEAKMRGMRLPNQAGRIELRWRGQALDVVQWHRKRPWPKQKPGFALERIAPDADGRVGASWRHATAPLRGIERASPGVLHWPCERLVDTAVHALCLETQRKLPQKLRSRARVCSAS